ncbi:MAG: lysophospholipid acyltransferase family protein [Christensenellales bacterium]
MKLWLYRLINFIARGIFFALNPRIVSGSGNMPESGGVLIVCNHLHFHDVFNVASCFRRRVTFMAKKELYENKFWGYLFKKYGSFPVDREGSSMSAMREAMHRLKNGEVLVVFPEGTRSKGDEMGEFKEGAALLAAKTGAHILPMYINAKGRFFTRIYVNIGEAFKLPAGKLDSQYLSKNNKLMRDKVLALRIYDYVPGAKGLTK